MNAGRSALTILADAGGMRKVGWRKKGSSYTFRIFSSKSREMGGAPTIHPSLRDLAHGEGVVVPMAVEGGGLGVGDEDPVDAEAGFEALEVGDLELRPAVLG